MKLLLSSWRTEEIFKREIGSEYPGRQECVKIQRQYQSPDVDIAFNTIPIIYDPDANIGEHGVETADVETI